MAVRKLTQILVDRINPPAQGHTYIWDATLPSFGLRVSHSGRKSWVCNCRVDGRMVPVTLGSTYLIPNLAEARDRARQAMLEARQGVHPIRAKRERIAQDKAQAEADAFTFRALVDEYLEWSRAKHKQSTHEELDRMMRRILADAAFADKGACDVTRSDLRSYLDSRKLGQRGAIEQGNRITTIKRMYRWAVDRDKLENNPAERLKPEAVAKPRSRYLSDAEITRFWQASEQIGGPFGDAYKLLLLTGARLSEVLGMRWQELDLRSRSWRLPAARVKNGIEHVVPLSDLALAILRKRPRIAHSQFVFTLNGTTPLRCGARAKQRLDALMRPDEPFVIHDLRRSMATGLQRLGVRLEVTEACLNHVSGSRGGIVGVYQRHHFSDEKREALDRWAAYLSGLVNGNIVSLRRA